MITYKDTILILQPISMFIEKFFKLYASICFMLAFLFFNNSFASDSNQSYCLSEFNNLKTTLDQNKVQMTTVVADSSGVTPFLMVNANINGKNYILWEHLNGEFKGYALRENIGFDYNTDRSYAGPLSWHPTRIWDKLFDPKTTLSGYSCVLAGRTRVAGHKASLIKLTPQDGFRYLYVIAKDDETALPIELILINPKTSTIVSRITSLDTKHIKYIDFPIKDEQFDKFEEQKNLNPDRKLIALSELNIPQYFKLVDMGRFDNDVGVYQTFSDGLISYRVYKTNATSAFFPVANKGAIIVLRKIVNNKEYAVVGEIPLELAELVLSKL